MIKKIKSTTSSISDFLILVYFFLIFYIILFGGFSIIVVGHEVSATSVYKPVSTLLILFIIKLLVANYKKEIEKKKILLASTLLFMMFISEVLARGYYGFFVPQDLAWASKNLSAKRKPNPDQLFGIDMIRVSSNKKITYEYIPGIKGYAANDPKRVPQSINNLGFIDDEDKTHTKSRGKFRIVGIGDSVMAGQGVHFKDTFGEVLERELNQRLKEEEMGTEVEFINLAVGGYNTTMEVETFFQKGIKFDPDLVIISYVPNDFNLPNFIIKKENPWVSKKSFAIFYINKRLQILANTKYGKFLGNITWQNQKKHLGVVELDMAMWRNKGASNPIGNNYEFVPEEYKFMVGIEAYLREMKRLKQKCDDLKIPLILQLDVPEEKVVENRERIAIQTAKELNIPLIKDHKEVRDFLKKRNALPEFFCVSDKDCHPNKWGHLIKGKKLASFIYANYLSRG
tara:strand:- start:87 stop:1454 length:1368 start_codon:yes stop_codon:yes gene_type:complete